MMLLFYLENLSHFGESGHDARRFSSKIQDVCGTKKEKKKRKRRRARTMCWKGIFIIENTHFNHGTHPHTPVQAMGNDTTKRKLLQSEFFVTLFWKHVKPQF